MIFLYHQILECNRTFDIMEDVVFICHVIPPNKRAFISRSHRRVSDEFVPHLVPFMALFYILEGLTAILLYPNQIPESSAIIFSDATDEREALQVVSYHSLQ
jgi:Na+/alanine symporter